MTYRVYVDLLFVYQFAIAFALLTLASFTLFNIPDFKKIFLISGLISLITTTEQLILVNFDYKVKNIVLICTETIIFALFIRRIKLIKVLRLVIVLPAGIIFLIGILELNKSSNIFIQSLLIMTIPFLLILTFKIVKSNCVYQRNLYEISLSANDLCINCVGYLDTGNTLTKSDSNTPILIINQEIAAKILGAKYSNDLHTYIKTGYWNYEQHHIDNKLCFFSTTCKTINCDCFTLLCFGPGSITYRKSKKSYQTVFLGVSTQDFLTNGANILLNANTLP